MPRKSPHFYWQIPEHGYKWTIKPGTKDNNQKTIILLSPKQQNDQWRTYYPLKNHTGLFQEFARLEPEENSILKFANLYGNLDQPHETHGNSKQDGKSSPVSFACWENEILTVRQILELWQMASTKDHQNLSGHVNWTSHGILIDNIYNPMHSDHTVPFLISTEVAKDLASNKLSETHIHLPVTEKTLEGFLEKEPYKPVLYLIQHITNYKIKNLIKPQLMLDDHKEKLNLKMKPYSLIGALWLQCVIALNENKVYATCSACSRWFELPLNVIKKGKKYCSDACKSKAYRERKKKKVA